MKTELAAMENERKKLEESREMWEGERLLYESACKDAEKKVEQYWKDMNSVILAKEVPFVSLDTSQIDKNDTDRYDSDRCFSFRLYLGRI